MSYEDLWNAIKRMVDAQLASIPMPKRGIVMSVDPVKMRAKVQIQPDPTGESVSNWYPIMTPCMGAGWGIVAAPPIGAQVMIVPTDGYADAAVVHGAHWSDAQLPPSGYAVGELWLHHETGAFVRLRNNGTVVAQDQSGSSLTFNNNGTMTIKANVLIEGTLSTTGVNGGTGDVTISGFVKSTGDQIAAYNGTNISQLNHQHSQNPDGHGDAEQNTNAPIAGT